MKKKSQLWLSAIVLIASIYGCTKHDPIALNSPEEKSTTADNNSSNRHLTLTQEEYDNLKIEIAKAFKGEQQSSQQNSINFTNLPHKSSTVIPEDLNNMYSENGVDQLINMNEAVIAKFPQLAGHRSMLNLYNDALRIEDKTQLKNYIKKYNYFLTYIEEFNTVVLSVPKYKAVLLSPEGIIRIDDNIIQYTDESIKIIKDGDADLISSLPTTTKSTDKIEVIKLDENSNKSYSRVKAVQEIKYLGPNSPYNLFAAIIIKFVDAEATVLKVPSYVDRFDSRTGRVIRVKIFTTYPYTRYSVGTECYSVFNGAFTPSQIGVASISSYHGGAISTDYGSTGSSVVASASKKYNSYPATHMLINEFAVISGWRIVYANGVVFEAAW